jgi:hypothetical protein
MYKGHNKRLMVLFLLLSVAIVAHHPSSPPFLILLLIAIVTINFVYDLIPGKKILRGQSIQVLFFTLVVAVYWVFISKEPIQAIFLSIFTPSLSNALEGFSTASPTIVDVGRQLYSYLPYSILFGLILSGVLLTLRSSRIGAIEKAAVVLGLGAAGLSFPNPLLSIEPFKTISFDRWSMYTPLFVGLASAAGFNALYKRVGTPGKVLAASLLVLLIFTSLTNPMIAADNPTFANGGQTPYLTHGETSATQFGTEYTPDRVMSDYTITRSIDSEKSHILIVDPVRRAPVTRDSDDIILIRHEELRERGLKVYPSSEYLYRPWVGRVEISETVTLPEGHYNQIYTNSDTSGYVSKSLSDEDSH